MQTLYIVIVRCRESGCAPSQSREFLLGQLITIGYTLIPCLWISVCLPRCVAWCSAKGFREICVGCPLLSSKLSCVLSSRGQCGPLGSPAHSSVGKVCAGQRPQGSPRSFHSSPDLCVGLPSVSCLPTSASHVVSRLPAFYCGGRPGPSRPTAAEQICLTDHETHVSCPDMIPGGAILPERAPKVQTKPENSGLCPKRELVVGWRWGVGLLFIHLIV